MPGWPWHDASSRMQGAGQRLGEGGTKGARVEAGGWAGSKRDGARLIICRALGPRGHTASGFCGDMSHCRLSTWPASYDGRRPSLCQGKGLVGPWSCRVTQAGSSTASVGPWLSPWWRGGQRSVAGWTWVQFWLCHLLADLGVPFDLPVPPCSLSEHPSLGGHLKRESRGLVPTW